MYPFEVCGNDGPCPSTSDYDCSYYCSEIWKLPYGGTCIENECCCYKGYNV